MSAIAVGLLFLLLITLFGLWAIISNLNTSRSPYTYGQCRRAVVRSNRQYQIGKDGDFRTEYFVTFIFMDNQEINEYRVPGRDFGLMKEGDVVDVWIEGESYLRFEWVRE